MCLNKPRCCLVLFFLGVGAWANVLLAQAEPGPTDAAGVGAIRNDQPAFLVRVDVNHVSRAYREGENLALRVTSEIDAFVHVIYEQADGQTYQVFPNSVQPDNRLKARQTVQIPARDDLFRWVVGPPFGREKVTVIASKEPLDELSASSLRQKRFNPVAQKQCKAIELELGEEEPSAWAEDHVEITTYPRNQELATSGARRWGVFFGVSNYEFNEEAEEARDGHGMNLATCHRDARQLADVLREVGQLSGVRVYTNEQATRKNLEDAVTRWLPARSRPGDTVVIYFSGHGGQLPDDNGDEVDDRLDEFLVPFDYLAIDVLSVLIEKAKQGNLEARFAPQVTRGIELLKNAGSVEKAAAMLARTTGVTDDLFGHWLQRLDKRQVIVILDICHAGGFATQEKDLRAGAKAFSFDFLDGEISRLKDIGQRESALLASSRAEKSSAVRDQNDLSVMTYYLVDSVFHASGTLTLDQAYQDCKGGMQQYFEERNRVRRASGKPPVDGHEPYMVNFCTRPALLKP